MFLKWYLVENQAVLHEIKMISYLNSKLNWDFSLKNKLSKQGQILKLFSFY